ncbi:hypothetical protein EIN_025890 [Entamoeba invadens IP1]|uniref:Uncharacterized protein n=1 Tax=Entamoeba invadens TaxID=33085 RepID=S0B3I7_ENTIV|nr:hypothetical protein EIN_025890 [Entamoeba invadens IP1]ELP90750.1 hypothetical protein EIN_025890 [Entamoeba invadens IP1]BAN42023.1 hypothetical protein [Entamoeba invadens]|eukprot:XP_004257521.1 hypothetical protein EIN_025890 [Entamoeba invadens IP1]
MESNSQENRLNTLSTLLEEVSSDTLESETQLWVDMINRVKKSKLQKLAATHSEARLTLEKGIRNSFDVHLDLTQDSNTSRCWLTYNDQNIIVIDLTQWSCPDVTPNSIQEFRMNNKLYWTTFVESYSSIVSTEKANELIVWQPPDTVTTNIEVQIPSSWPFEVFPFILQHRSHSIPTLNIHQDIQKSTDKEKLPFEDNFGFEEIVLKEIPPKVNTPQVVDIPVILPLPVDVKRNSYSIIFYDFWTHNLYKDLIQVNVTII